MSLQSSKQHMEKSSPWSCYSERYISFIAEPDDNYLEFTWGYPADQNRGYCKVNQRGLMAMPEPKRKRLLALLEKAQTTFGRR